MLASFSWRGITQRTVNKSLSVYGISSRHLSSYQPCIDVRTVDEGSAVEVDGSVFHSCWLWSNDPVSIHSSSGQRLRSPGQFPHTKITGTQIITFAAIPLQKQYRLPPAGSFHPVGGISSSERHVNLNAQTDQLLEVTWDNNDISYFDIAWLKQCRYDSASLNAQNKCSQVTKSIALGASSNQSANHIATFNYSELLSHDSALLQAFDALNEYGAVMVHEAPSSSHDAGTVSSLGQHMTTGSLSHGTLYDDVFRVQSAADAINIANTEVALPPHQDLTYYESKPFLQLLHCVKNQGIVGGQSVLMDAMAAAHEFRLIAPDLFEILSAVEATFVKQRQAADMVSRKPHIICSCSELNDVVAVHWAPPFEGPLAIHAELVNDYYVAYAAFERMLDNSLPQNLATPLSSSVDRTLRQYALDYTWEQAPRVGQILVFNNQRMLHGRRAFRMTDEAVEGPDDAGRELIGCYTNVDETMSRYRLLLRDLMSPCAKRIIRNVGNGVRSS